MSQVELMGLWISHRNVSPPASISLRGNLLLIILTFAITILTSTGLGPGTNG
jgi:hypothetical protein